MNARTLVGSLLGFILVLLLYAKLADLAEGATHSTPPEAKTTAVANTGPGAVAPDAAGAPPAEEAQSSRTRYWLFGSFVVLLLGGLVYGRVEARNKLLLLDREEKDPPFLEELLKAYPDKISELLSTPRQIKRFSSKVRLQHNLMYNMARQQQAYLKTRFNFSEEEQILSFMYLLLIEHDRETARKLVNTPKPEFKETLRKIALEEYDYKSFLNDDRIRGGNKAALMLERANDEVLVQQLCRLNLGALV